MKRTAFLLLLIAALAACGNKGALVLPSPEAAPPIAPAAAEVVAPDPEASQPVPPEPSPDADGTPAR